MIKRTITSWKGRMGAREEYKKCCLVVTRQGITRLVPIPGFIICEILYRPFQLSKSQFSNLQHEDYFFPAYLVNCEDKIRMVLQCFLTIKDYENVCSNNARQGSLNTTREESETYGNSFIKIKRRKNITTMRKKMKTRSPSRLLGYRRLCI